jgi:hypothetical protein
VIDIFNRRFVVPFTLHVENRADVVAGKDKIMKLGFTYDDGDEDGPVEIDREHLLEYLSNGEKKAFYIHLNSFMYEPLIDMNEDRLKRLYEEVKSLS